MSGFEDERIDLKTFLPVNYESKRLLRSLQSLDRIELESLHHKKKLLYWYHAHRIWGAQKAVEKMF